MEAHVPSTHYESITNVIERAGKIFVNGVLSSLESGFFFVGVLVSPETENQHQGTTSEAVSCPSTDKIYCFVGDSKVP